MWIIGLTGSMGAGKSTLAKAFRLEGIPVHDADAEIHRLLEEDREIIGKVRVLWPEVFKAGKIVRQKLRKRVLSSPQALSHLEQILYPGLLKEQKRFLKTHQSQKCPMAVLDVPLLYETGLDRYCHFVVVASSPAFLREKRVISRKGVTPQDFEGFEHLQVLSLEKERRADAVIQTGRDKGTALKQLRRVLTYLRDKPTPRWSGRWPAKLRRETYDQRDRSRYGNNWI